MPRNCVALFNRFAKQIRALDQTRVSIERLRSANQISLKAKLHLYEGLFLNVHVSFESFIEELFVGLLVTGNGLVSSNSNIHKRIVVRSHKIARSIIFGPNKTYVDWVPYDNTLSLANLFYRGGVPFSDLNSNQKSVLKKIHIIRNAIAHKSRASTNKFITEIIGNVAIPPAEKRPAAYLAGVFRVSPKQTRYEYFVTQLLLISQKLTS